MVTFPLPKPLGITSLLLNVRVLIPELFRAVRSVSPLQELFVFTKHVSPLTVVDAPKVSLNGPEIGPTIAPLPCPPISESPINVMGPVKYEPEFGPGP